MRKYLILLLLPILSACSSADFQASLLDTGFKPTVKVSTSNGLRLDVTDYLPQIAASNSFNLSDYEVSPVLVVYNDDGSFSEILPFPQISEDLRIAGYRIKKDRYEKITNKNYDAPRVIEKPEIQTSKKIKNESEDTSVVELSDREAVNVTEENQILEDIKLHLPQDQAIITEEFAILGQAMPNTKLEVLINDKVFSRIESDFTGLFKTNLDILKFEKFENRVSIRNPATGYQSVVKRVTIKPEAHAAALSKQTSKVIVIPELTKEINLDNNKNTDTDIVQDQVADTQSESTLDIEEDKSSIEPNSSDIQSDTLETEDVPESSASEETEEQKTETEVDDSSDVLESTELPAESTQDQVGDVQTESGSSDDVEIANEPETLETEELSAGSVEPLTEDINDQNEQ